MHVRVKGNVNNGAETLYVRHFGDMVIALTNASVPVSEVLVQVLIIYLYKA